MNLFIFLGLIFLFTFVIGHLLEKMRIPGIFAALLFGVAFSTYNPFSTFTSSHEFQFMSNVGLYLLLFLIGFELDIKNIRQSGPFIVKTTFVIELAEALLVGTALHFIFSLSWPLAFIVALSFATVGEAILLPILEELGLIKSKVGQLILGVSTFDDIFELAALLSIVFVTPIFVKNVSSHQLYDPLLTNALIFLVALLLFVLIVIRKLKKEITLMKIPNVSAVLPLLLAVFFIFIGIDNSQNKDVAVLGALFAGIVLKNLLPSHLLEEVEPQIKTITFGLFAPIFFLGIGLDTNISYLFSHIWIIVVIMILANLAKLVGTYLVGRKELGDRPSIFMGIALGVRFSTSLVFLKILLDNNIIGKPLYTVLIGTSIIFKFIIPVMLATLAKRWKKDLEK